MSPAEKQGTRMFDKGLRSQRQPFTRLTVFF